jgi:hypothetical protein
MTVPDTSHLEPWLEHLRNPNHRDWFRKAFSKILLFEYVPQDLWPNDIQDGHDLIWQKDNTYIIASGFIQFNRSGERPGIYFEDDTNDYQIQISVNAPLEVVHAAIKHINPDRE